VERERRGARRRRGHQVGGREEAGGKVGEETGEKRRSWGRRLRRRSARRDTDTAAILEASPRPGSLKEG